jgi:hypothetical protein
VPSPRDGTETMRSNGGVGGFVGRHRCFPWL